jgi:pyruvate/2-oxoglutarate dehydrogenase complex dihydrolipoamide acyltransferase (E2) component
MGYVVNMPKLEMGMQQGVVIEWYVSVDDPLEEGDLLVEIESEKTVTDIEAREDGVLRRIYLAEGEAAEPGSPMAIVAGVDEDISELEAGIERVESSADAATATAGADAVDGEGGTGADVDEESGTDDAGGGETGRVRASPKARRRAKDLGVNLSTVKGTGPSGAVTVDDVERVVEDVEEEDDGNAGSVKATETARELATNLDVDLATVDGTGPRGVVTERDVEDATDGQRPTDDMQGAVVEQRKLTGMRRAIAARLGESYRNAVHVTVHRTVDVEELLAAATVADDYLTADVSVTDLLLVAVSETLAEHPAFNAIFEDGTHTLYKSQNVGIAVDVDRGLVTPVIERVDERSLSDIAVERNRLTDLVVAGDHEMSDLAGGTFTVSNLGVFGVDSFTPIINPPQVAILGIDRIQERPVRDGDDVTFRRHVGFDLTFDHRVIDGADAARFLATLAGHVREPWELLLTSVDR